jgi:hypothetical protein
VRGRRGLFAQAALLATAVAIGGVAFAADTPVFWPLAVFATLVPLCRFPGRPESSPGLVLALALLASTAITHAVFFGEDRYHMVVTPVFALLAAGALRGPARRSASPGV